MKRKVRIALAVGGDGSYNAWAASCNNETREEQMRSTANGLEPPIRCYWIETEVDLPTAPETIRVKVKP